MRTSDYSDLRALLERRLQVIADEKLRAEDAGEQLRQLQEVSDAIDSEQRRLSAVLPPQLRHFLTQASFGKALDWIVQREV